MKEQLKRFIKYYLYSLTLLLLLLVFLIFIGPFYNFDAGWKTLTSAIEVLQLFAKAPPNVPVTILLPLLNPFFLIFGLSGIFAILLLVLDKRG